MKRRIFYETTVCKCYHGENMGVFSLEPGEGPSLTLASTWRTHAPEPMWICINRMMEKSQHCSWSDAHQFENTGRIRIRQKIVRKSLERNLRTESNKNIHLVGGFNHLEKYESVGKDYPIYYGKQNVWNHQPVNRLRRTSQNPPKISLEATAGSALAPVPKENIPWHSHSIPH